MVHSEQGENVSKGPGEKRNKMVQGRCGQCWGSLLGTVGTTVRGPGSSHCLCPTCQTSLQPLLPTPTLKSPCANFWIDATSQISVLSSLLTQFLLLASPLCLMKPIPSRWASPPSAKPSWTPDLPPTLPISLLHKNPCSSNVGLYLFLISRPYHHACCFAGAQ